MKSTNLIHGKVKLPAFFPDGTYGSVKSIDFKDLMDCKIDGIVMNTFHLYTKSNASIIKKHGGINLYGNFQQPILTDSGGFQVFSLLRENKNYGQIRENNIIFRPNQNSKKIIFSPEKCIQMQFALKSDILMCLDYCTHPEDDYSIQKKSIETTIRWAKKCKMEYELQLKNYQYNIENRPMLFAIIQGGNDHKLRKYCADSLCALGFDGYGFGGWPIDNSGALTTDILQYTAELMPYDKIKYAMGIGRPEEIISCVDMGYNLFDCVIPTREARHQRLYVYNSENIQAIDIREKDFYSYLYILDDKYINDTMAVSSSCDCFCCNNYSKSFLRHLFKVNDPLALRLASIHNLRFYSILMELLQNEKR